jgi:hypothetical protein
MKKVLLIAYHFDPFPGVGVKRVSFWNSNFHKYEIESHVITATEQNEDSDRITYVKDTGKPGLLGKVIKDAGLSWKNDLVKYFDKQENIDFDLIILTGGPFMHFGLVTYLKSKFKIKVALDYRDPFATQPRHPDSKLKKIVKTYYEKKFNKEADFITTVNEVCKKDMECTEKVTVIPNGFDDVALGNNEAFKKEENLLVSLFCGGKIYDECRVDSLLEVVSENKELSFSQFGFEYDYIVNLNNPRINSTGFMPYNEMLSELGKADIAILLTRGRTLESPTKMYDYVGLKKKILVLSEGEFHVGIIGQVLKDNPNVQWSKNTPSEIKKAIDILSKREQIDFNNEEYSRSHSLGMLSKLIMRHI